MPQEGGDQQKTSGGGGDQQMVAGGGGVGGGNFYATWLYTATDGAVRAHLLVLPSEGLTISAVLDQIQTVVPGFASQLFYRGMI
jgi:hypothetical protein